MVLTDLKVPTLISYNSQSYSKRYIEVDRKATEDIKVPENLSFLKEPLVITSVVMIIIYVFLALMADQPYLRSSPRVEITLCMQLCKA